MACSKVEECEAPGLAPQETIVFQKRNGRKK